MMAKKRRRITQERVIRAKPPESVKPRIRIKPKKVPTLKEIRYIKDLQNYTDYWDKRIRRQPKKPITMISINQSPPCQAKKDRARHDYFSMIKSGQGRRKSTGQHRNRFTVKC